MGLKRPRVHHHRRQRRFQGGELLDRELHQRRARRLPGHLRGLPLGRVDIRQRLSDPGFDIAAGTVTTSWSTSQPGGSSDYNVAYDIWFNQTPATSGQPNGTELMIWLNHNGPVQPVRLEGRQQCQHRRPQLQRVVRQAGLEHHRHLRDDRRHGLGQPPGPAAPGGRRGEPRLRHTFVVPDRRGGRLRAVAGWPGLATKSFSVHVAEVARLAPRPPGQPDQRKPDEPDEPDSEQPRSDQPTAAQPGPDSPTPTTPAPTPRIPPTLHLPASDLAQSPRHREPRRTPRWTSRTRARPWPPT